MTPRAGYITRKEAARRHHVTERTISRWIDQEPDGSVRFYYARKTGPGGREIPGAMYIHRRDIEVVAGQRLEGIEQTKIEGGEDDVESVQEAGEGVAAERKHTRVKRGGKKARRPAA